MAEQENSEDPNPYVAVPTSTPEAAQFAQAGNIRLPSIVDTTGKTNFLSRIGQLRMDYSDGQGETRKYNGTATVFSAQRKDDSTYLLYAVTCAHNVQLDDPMKPNLKCRSVTFEVRESSKTGSKALQSFQATPDDWYVHPDYDPQSRIPSHDLAIIQFKVSKQEAARFRFCL